jgi:predicted dehydrogenase
VAAAVPPAERTARKERFFADVLPIESVSVPEANAIAAEHDDFLEAIRTARSPLVTAAAGAAALEIAARVLEALECRALGSGKPAAVAVPCVPFRRTA